MRNIFTMKRIIAIVGCIFCWGVLWAQPQQYSLKDGLMTDEVRQLVELPDGRVLVNTEGDFSLFNGREFIGLDCRLDSVYHLHRFGGYDYLMQGDSVLWLKDFYSLYLYDLRSLRFRYDVEPRMGELSVKQFVEENGDSLMSRLTRRMVTQWQGVLDSISSYPGQYSPTSAVIDRQGGRWIGTRGNGIFYLRPKMPMALHFSFDGDEVQALAQIDDRYLMAGTTRSLYLYDTQQQEIVQTLSDNCGYCPDASRDSKGRVWVCSKIGILCYDHGELQLYDSHNVKGFIHSQMRFVREISEGRYLVCNLMNCVGYFYPERREFVPLNPQLPEIDSYRTIVGACFLPQTKQWAVYSQNGLFLLDVDSNRLHAMDALLPMKRYSEKYNCMAVDAQQRIWIGTQNGLLLLDGQSVRRFTRNDGLSNNCIKSIVEDTQGRVWVGTSLGISRITFAQGDTLIASFGASDGIPNYEMTERNALLLADSTLWFANTGGLTAIPVHLFDVAQSPMPVRFVGLKVMDRDCPINQATLDLPYNENDLTLQFSTLNYANPEHTQYRYRLKGADTHWRYVTDGQPLATVHYNSLPPNGYLFEAQASVSNGEWGETLQKAFVINPPFWLTWWAKLLYTLIVCFVAFYLLNLYLKRRKAKMELENEDKVNRLFELREEARHQFAQSVNIDPEKIGINKEEEMLVKQLLCAMENHMDDVDYTVVQLAQDVALSRSNLYRRMEAMLGITPNDFMRNVRLKRAAKLLSETDLPVNKIALMVGFGTPRYFSQYFKKMYGVTPNEYSRG